MSSSEISYLSLSSPTEPNLHS